MHYRDLNHQPTSPAEADGEGSLDVLNVYVVLWTNLAGDRSAEVYRDRNAAVARRNYLAGQGMADTTIVEA